MDVLNARERQISVFDEFRRDDLEEFRNANDVL
jgi:hypothetical protein